MFWACTLEEFSARNRDEKRTVPQPLLVVRPFHVSRAVIDIPKCTRRLGSTMSHVHVVTDKGAFNICNLRFDWQWLKMRSPDVALDLTFSRGDKVAFYASSMKREMHDAEYVPAITLTGYWLDA